MSGPLLGHRPSLALAGVTNISYVGVTYIGFPNIEGSSWRPNATVIAGEYPTYSKIVRG
jgi:hypothetical protein